MDNNPITQGIQTIPLKELSNIKPSLVRSILENDIICLTGEDNDVIAWSYEKFKTVMFLDCYVKGKNEKGYIEGFPECTYRINLNGQQLDNVLYQMSYYFAEIKEVVKTNGQAPAALSYIIPFLNKSVGVKRVQGPGVINRFDDTLGYKHLWHWRIVENDEFNYNIVDKFVSEGFICSSNIVDARLKSLKVSGINPGEYCEWKITTFGEIMNPKTTTHVHVLRHYDDSQDRYLMLGDFLG